MSPRAATKPKPNLDHIHPNLRALAVPVDTLTLDPRNARLHSDENVDAVARSLERFGQRQPLVVQRSGSIVLAGNARLRAAQALGWTHVAALVVEDSAAEATAYKLADNRTAELATWDDDLLSELIRELEAEDFGDLTVTGFDAREIEVRFRATVGGAAATADDEVQKEGAPERVSAGETWHLGRHRLLCGDAFGSEADAFIEAASIPIIVTDPPYAIYGSSTGITASIADDKMVRPFFEALGKLVHRALRTYGILYSFTDWRSWAAVWYGFGRAGLSPKNCIVWDKGDGGMGGNYAMCHEFIGYFAKLPPQKSMKSTSRGHGGRQATVLRPNIKRFNRVTGKEREHNAQKPVDLIRELLVENSAEGDRVLDPFAGYGSTLIAAEREGRAALLVEIEPRWCDAIIARWERETGGTARRDGDAPARPRKRAKRKR